MKILAIESSSLVASVAVTEDGVTVAEYTVNFKKTHSQTLLPMIDQIAAMTELDMDSVDAIAVSGGPGSFTGLRIGSATAKGLGAGSEKAVDSCSYAGCDGMESLWGIRADLSCYGCAEKSGLYRIVPV